MIEVDVQFAESLQGLLYARYRSAVVRRRLREKTSVKDLIESCGVPHTEVDLIVAEGVAVGLGYSVDRSAKLEVYGFGEGPSGFADERLLPIGCERFVADGHLGKLVKWLRLLGLDVAYQSQIEDAELLRIMRSENRGLLTRDRRLLMHRVVEVGYCPRSDWPEAQAEEVVARFRLGTESRLATFTRCLHCNGLLEPVEKDAIESRLEPLTREHYDVFRQCSGCGRIYWEGSHANKLRALIQRVTAGKP